MPLLSQTSVMNFIKTVTRFLNYDADMGPTFIWSNVDVEWDGMFIQSLQEANISFEYQWFFR